jgi:hypothetical protein
MLKALKTQILLKERAMMQEKNFRAISQLIYKTCNSYNNGRSN